MIRKYMVCNRHYIGFYLNKSFDDAYDVRDSILYNDKYNPLPDPLHHDQSFYIVHAPSKREAVNVILTRRYAELLANDAELLTDAIYQRFFNLTLVNPENDKPPMPQIKYKNYDAILSLSKKLIVLASVHFTEYENKYGPVPSAHIPYNNPALAPSKKADFRELFKIRDYIFEKVRKDMPKKCLFDILPENNVQDMFVEEFGPLFSVFPLDAPNSIGGFGFLNSDWLLYIFDLYLWIKKRNR